MTIAEAVMEAWIRSGVGLALAIAAVLVLRKLVGAALGPRAVRFFWFAVPLSVFAAWLPAWMEPSSTPNGTSMLQGAVAAVAVEVGATTATPWWAWGFSAWLVGALALGLLLWQRQRRFEARISSTADGGERRLPPGESPAVIGAWRPRIVLPRDFESRFTADEQALILAHEQLHVRRHDGAWSLLAYIVLCVQWFNPLAWIAMHAFRDDRERACDAEVMQQHPRSAKAYASALLKQVQGPWAPLASAWASRHPVVGRIAAIGDHRRLQRFDRVRFGAAIVLCAGVVAVAHAAAPRDFDAGAAPSDGSGRFVRMAFELSSGESVVAQPVVVVREGEAATVRVDGPRRLRTRSGRARPRRRADRRHASICAAPRRFIGIDRRTNSAGWRAAGRVRSGGGGFCAHCPPDPDGRGLDDVGRGRRAARCIASTSEVAAGTGARRRTHAVSCRARHGGGPRADGCAAGSRVGRRHGDRRRGRPVECRVRGVQPDRARAVRDCRNGRRAGLALPACAQRAGVPKERWVLVPVRYSTKPGDAPPG